MVADRSIKIRDIELKIRELKAKQKELDNSIFIFGAGFISQLEKLKAKLNKLASQLSPQLTQKCILAALPLRTHEIRP